MPFDAINYQGRNLAPVEPLQDAKRTMARPKDNPSSINAFFRELWQGYSEAHEAERREIIEQGRVISIMRAGKLTIKSDPLGSGGYVYFKPLSSNGGRDRSNFPLFPQNSETLKSKWVKSRVQVAPRVYGGGHLAAIQADEAKTVVADYFRNIFTPTYELREALSAQDYGTYATLFEYDDKLNQMIELAPIIQNESKVVVDGYGACYDCKYQGHPKDFRRKDGVEGQPQCPECDGFRTTRMVDDVMGDVANITGVEEIRQGDIRGRLLDFPAYDYDPRVLPHESDYFLLSESAPIRLLRKMFGEDLDIEEADADEIGFQVMEALATRGGSIEGHGANDHYGEGFTRFRQEAYLRHMWLKPACYAGFKLEEAEQTLAGTIPAGVDFGEIFPAGICVRGFNDMKLQVGIYAEECNISSGVYFLMSHSGRGKGVQDAVDVARDMNEIHSMAMSGLKRYGAAGIAIDANAGLTPEMVRNLFKPQKAVFVNLNQIEGGDINKAIKQLQPNPVNPVLPQYMIQLSNLLNMTFLNGDFTQGMTQDVDINTLGGQRLAHAKTEEQKGAIITQKVSHRELAGSIIWRLFTRHIKIPRYYNAASDTQSRTRGKLLSGAGRSSELKFDAIEGTEAVMTQAEKQFAARDMINEAGGLPVLLQAAMADPRITSWYTKLFGVEMPTLSDEEIAIVCLGRLSEIKDLSEVYATPDEILMSLSNTPRIREASHLLKADFVAGVLDDDDFQTWNPLAKATTEALIDLHYSLEAQAQLQNQMLVQDAQNQLAMRQANANTAIAQPQIDQAQAMQDQATQQQQDQAADAEQKGVLAEVGSRLLDEGAKEADHERQMEQMAMQGGYDEVRAAADHDRGKDMERHKAALNPPAKKKAGAR